MVWVRREFTSKDAEVSASQVRTRVQQHVHIARGHDLSVNSVNGERPLDRVYVLFVRWRTNLKDERK
jgi:hypothetical protein